MDVKHILYFVCRHANPGDAAARYVAHVGKRPSTLFLRVLHFRHRRRPVVGGHPTSAVLPQTAAQHQLPSVSTSQFLSE